MTRYCSSCGNPVEAGDIYCMICGERVAPEAASQDQSRTSARASIYVEPQAAGVTKGGFFEVPIEPESPYDIANTEVRGVINTERSQLPTMRDDNEDDDDAEGADTLTVVVQPLDDDDVTPTTVITHERYMFVRQRNGERIEVTPPCMVGRGTAADSRVRGNLSISRRHAKLLKQGDEVLIQDLASSNGTYVDGRRLEEDESAPLTSGSVVRLGDEDFVFSVEVSQ